MTDEERKDLCRITRGLMLSENLGDVHDGINELHDFLDLPRPEGSFLGGDEGWTDKDFETLGGRL